MPAPGSAPQVSPLAVSNVNSQRGAFENAVTSGPASTAAVAAGLVGVITHPENEPSQGGIKRSAVAGTQMMPSSANPAPAAPSKRQDRTQLLAPFPPGTVPRPGAPGPRGAGAAAAPPAAGMAGSPSGSGLAAAAASPSAGSLPVADPQRISAVPSAAGGSAPPAQPPAAPQMQQPAAWSPAAVSFAVGQPSPAIPYGAPAPYAPPPMPPPQQPQQPQPMAPPPAPPAYGFGFAYVPGSRVTVTWSNGGRYPGTVQQVSGTQCLVVFPDGQQHWVEMQYVAPA